MTLELGEISQAKLSVTSYNKWEEIVSAKSAQLKRVKLYLAIRKGRSIPMGGKHLGGTWSKPETSTSV